MNLLKFILKDVVLFWGLFFLSTIIVHIFAMIGLKFENMSNTAFIAALFATIVLNFIQCSWRKDSRKKSDE